MSNCFSNSFPTFQPAMRIITNISNADPAVITTSTDHNYITGEIVRLIVPPLFQMHGISGRLGKIDVIDDTHFFIDIDTTFLDPFEIPPMLPESYTCAHVVPVGEVNGILDAATKNVLPTGRR